MRWGPDTPHNPIILSTDETTKYIGLTNKEVGPRHTPHGDLLAVPFGHKAYEQYKDLALGLYSDKDHNHREEYRARHGAILNREGKPYKDIKQSASWWSWNYLW